MVGNKKDLTDMREVTLEEASAFAAENKLFFLETSALDNSDQMIEKVFMTLSQNIIKMKNKAEDEPEASQTMQGKGKQMELRESRDAKPEEKKKGGCC